jgi:flagellin
MINKLLNNEGADYALLNSRQFNRQISKSLRNLGSGLRINTAIDDSASMQIADGLKLQYTAHKQAARNAEQTSDIVKIASNAIKEQVNILAKIKTKAIQASQDSLTKDAKVALQKETVFLIDQLDRIALSTKYNGQSLLTGNYSNKEFQIGAYSHEIATLSFGSLLTSKIGSTSFLTGQTISAETSGAFTVTLSTGKTVSIGGLVVSTGAGTGIGAIADTINGASDQLEGLKAYWKVQETGTRTIAAGDIDTLVVNGITFENIDGVKAGDADGRLLSAFKKNENDTGVEAFIGKDGAFNLRSIDGRGIRVTAASGLDTVTSLLNTFENYGRLTLSKPGSGAFNITDTSLNLNLDAAAAKRLGTAVINLRESKNSFTQAQAEAVGMFANNNMRDEIVINGRVSPGLLTIGGASALMDIVENSISQIDVVAADIASNYNALVIASDNNESQSVSTQAAHTELVGVDFAVESSNFSKANVLAQAGTYALTKAQQVVQNVFKLLEV